MTDSLPELHPSDSVRDLLARFPQTAAVFERRGLLGCGGRSGPDERLDIFAAAHRVPFDVLRAELREALAGPAPRAEAITPQEAQAATLYRRFLRTALVCTLTLGATFGAANLLVIQLGLGELPPQHNWVHASFQLFGFVLFFIMGVSYHALPRFLGTPLRGLRAAKASYWLALAGLLARGYGEFGSLLPATAPTLLAGAVLQLAALIAFAGVLAATYRAARPALEPFHCYLGAGLAGWLAAGGLLLAEGLSSVRAGDSAAAALHEPLYFAALFGGALPFIEGFLLRTGPAFLGLPAPRRRGLIAALWLGAGGTALAGVGAAASDALLDCGLLLLGASIAAFVASSAILRASGGHFAAKDPSFPRIVRQAVAWALVAAVLAVLYGALDLAGVSPPSLLFDGLRHALALGFVTLLIFGMAGRIVPIFGGTDLRWPALRAAGTQLIFLGVLLRELEVVASVTAPWLLTVSAWSGVVAATGVALASASLLATISGAARASADAGEPEGPVALEADANVYALVTAHPEALAVLIRAGFAPLANPVARQVLARAVSLRQACAMHGRDAQALLADLREACAREHLRPPPPPPIAPAAGPAPEEEPLPPVPPLTALGGPLAPAALLDVLHHVYDPELGIDIVDLGLVYGVDVAPPGRIRVRMTLTSPHCPAGQGLAAEVDEILRSLPGVEDVAVDLTFEPPWSPERMSASARAELGLA